MLAPMGELENRLRAARYYARLDQDVWADALETSVATINRIETEVKTVDPDKERYLLEGAARVTGWPVSFFTADLATLDRSSNRPPGTDMSRELNRLTRELSDLRKAHAREMETVRRSVASDRGRLTRIERNLNTVAEAVLQGRQKKGKP